MDVLECRTLRGIR